LKRVCLLTGGSGKLGRAFCTASAKDYQIVSVYRSRPLSGALLGVQGVPPIVDSSAAEGCANPILEIHADLRVEKDRARIVDVTLERFGRIDLLVNGAVHAIWSSMLKGDRSVESASAQFEMNVVVPLKLSVLCAQKFWRNRKAENLAGNRNVINVSSIAGSKVYLKLGQGVYAASKAALDQLSRHMADEFGEIGIRVNAFAPNSFPRVLPVQAVVESLKSLDRGTMTGRVLVLDRAGETFI
jgi:NAD(P)-dependent dehydrogenase (short-subunit alcohol dehydrogenase family)